jgi:hypothetical protein
MHLATNQESGGSSPFGCTSALSPRRCISIRVTSSPLSSEARAAVLQTAGRDFEILSGYEAQVQGEAPWLTADVRLLYPSGTLSLHGGYSSTAERRVVVPVIRVRPSLFAPLASMQAAQSTLTVNQVPRFRGFESLLANDAPTLDWSPALDGVHAVGSLRVPVRIGQGLHVPGSGPAAFLPKDGYPVRLRAGMPCRETQTAKGRGCNPRMHPVRLRIATL